MRTVFKKNLRSDGQATISQDWQQARTAQAILQFIRGTAKSTAQIGWLTGFYSGELTHENLSASWEAFQS